MSEISLKIKANFEQANEAFNDIAGKSEYAAKKIAAFVEKFKDDHVDNFIARQKLAGAALNATRGEAEAMTAQYAAYGREIERLIKAGLDPESEAVQQLKDEYLVLGTAIEKNVEQEKAAAAAAEAAVKELEKEADVVIKQLDAKGNLQKENVRLKQSQEDIKDEIKDLIKDGYDPESEAVQQLEGDYRKLTKEIEANEKAQKILQNASKIALGAIAATGAAIVAAGGYAVKAAADVEDMTAAFTPLMGSADKAAQLVKRIQVAAAATPFEIDKIGNSVKSLMPAFNGSADEAMKAFQMIGDTAQGNGQKLETITNAYTKVMLKGKVSMEELNMIAGAGVPIFAELSESMGVTVADMMELSKGGDITAQDLEKVFQKMTSDGGIFFEGMEVSSTTFNSTILGVQENLSITASLIGEKLLPRAKEIAGAVYDTTRAFIEWINTGDNLENLLKTLTYALAGVTAGITAFLIVTKVIPAIQAFTTALAASDKMAKSTVFGAIAGIIVSILIPALIALYKNWDTVQTYLQQGIAHLEYAFKWLGSVIKEGLVVAFNGIKIAAATMFDFIVGNVIRSVGGLLEIMGKLPFVGELFGAASQAVNGLGNAIGDLAARTKEESAIAIQAAHDEQNEIQSTLDAKLAAINEEAIARRNELERQKAENAVMEEEQTRAAVEAEQARGEAVSEASLEMLKKKLELMGETEAQAENERVDMFTQFLQRRLDAEKLDGDQRIAFLEEQRNLVIENTMFENEEIEALNKAHRELEQKEEEKLAAKEKEINEKKLSAFKGTMDNISGLLEEAAKENRAAAIASRVLAAAEASINTALAATKALSSAPPPLNFLLMGSVIAAGIAQVVKISTTPIPSAETGGRFLVPDVGGVDGNLIRVNKGETVDVTPRGENGYDNRPMVFNLVMPDGSVLASAINKLAQSGELYTLQLAGNL